MFPKNDLTADRVIAALQAAGERVHLGKLAEHLGVSRMMLHRFIETHPTCKQVLDDIKESRLDTCENCLMERIEDGSDKLIMFLLNTQGKDRGYGEQTVIIQNTPLQVEGVNK